MALYLLASAVNLAATIFDGNDLSVIRGSSARLLQASEDLFQHLHETFSGQAQVDRLAVGASELFVQLAATAPSPALVAPAPMSNTAWRRARETLIHHVEEGTPLDQAVDGWLAATSVLDRAGSRASIIEQVRDELAARSARRRPAEQEVDHAIRCFFALPSQQKLRHFTFLHAFHRPSGEERLYDILSALFSKLRTRQMQSLRLSPPEIVTRPAPASRAFCSLTLGRRPAEPEDQVHGKPASRSAIDRRTDGRRQKQKFYEAQLHRSARAAHNLSDDGAQRRIEAVLQRLQSDNVGFARDFEAIVANPPDDTMPPNVRSKLAVLFMDGNDFGAFRASCANVVRGNAYDNNASHAAYRDFCLALERNSGLILAGLLDWMMDEDDWFIARNDSGQKYLRFETLLFGGDDICFLLPAWGAFALMARLQEILRTLAAPIAGSRKPLTYKAGMVIGDRNSPIRDLRHVAAELAGAAKKTASGRNVVQVAVLEGLDRAELDPAALREDLFGSVPAEIRGVCSLDSAFGLEGRQWADICSCMAAIGSKVGRSQLHKWYALAENEGVLKSPEMKPRDVPEQWREFVSRRATFMQRFGDRLVDLPGGRPFRDVLTGADPLLAAGAADWPLLPLHHVLTLADYIEAMPFAAPAARGAA